MPQANVATGITLGYVEEGPLDAASLLLLPPMARDHNLWSAHLPAFSRDFRCIVPDHRGTGESDKPASGYTLGQFADDALAMLDELGVESAHVAGSSMGSAVAMELALRAPERVRSLSLYMPWARTDNNVRESFRLMRALTKYAPPFDRELAISWLIFSPQFLNESWDQVELLAREATNSPAYPPTHVALGHIDAGIAHDVLERLGTIGAPTLVVAGEQDRLLPASYAEEVRDAIPGARYHLFTGPRSSHALTAELFDDFLEVALGFLRDVEIA